MNINLLDRDPMSQAIPLLVPIDVQAMVLNNRSVNFIRAQMNYGNLEECQSPSPAPFQEDEVNFASDVKNHGVYLRWTLPLALRHADVKRDGSLEFPLVPNRWLVVRVYRPAVTGAPSVVTPRVDAWVVQSDALGTTDGAEFLDSTNSVFSPILIGRMAPISPASPWREPGSSPPLFLRAVAESNLSFTAYQPFNQNVFSIHDSLQTEEIGAGTLSYFVQGWYSDPKADILACWKSGPNEKGFAGELARLGWRASASNDGARTSLYHGGAFGVTWKPLSEPPRSPKDDAKPRIAVGNTSVDAVVAFAEAAFSAPHVTLPPGMKPEDAANYLEAFQYNLIPLLSVPGGEEQLEQAIRSQWFGSVAAGTSWTIVDAPVPPGSPAPKPLDAGELANERDWLGALNRAQGQFDQTMRALIGVQRKLFELWWKQQTADSMVEQGFNYPWNTSAAQFTGALDPTAPEGLVAQARDLLAELVTLATQIPCATATVTLEEAIKAFDAKKHLPPTRLLKAIAQPRFWTAADPVTVLSGTAHLIKVDPDGTLQCRWPAELVTALKVNTGAGGPVFAITSAELAVYRPLVNFTNLPAETSAVFAEFFLLDPANAVLIAAAAGHNSLTSEQLTALAASMAKPTPAAGAAPAILAAYPWEQPWQPLYLDWEVMWYPVPFLDPNGVANWAFDGTEYDLAHEVNAPSPATLSGRCVLTPKPAFEFKARIDQFIADNPESPASIALQEIEGLIETVDGWDFLSQALAGFGTELASWNPVPTLMPSNTPLAGGKQGFADLIGAQSQCPPDPLNAEGSGEPRPSTFEGMRGGQFGFSRLTIVDVFGQTLEVVTQQNAPNTSILTSDGLQVTRPIVKFNEAGYAQLPPRLLQPARLNFRFAPAAGSTNPILGWILPNHIDGSLAVYGVDGAHYGDLSPAVDVERKSFVFWWAAPDTPYPTLAALREKQVQFGGFLAALQAAGPVAFGEFLRSIDETRWTVDPLGDRNDAFLSVLLGRPLAVVNAAVSFELQAAAWTDPGWPYTFVSPRPSPFFLKYQFPVRLGDVASRSDGLLGYFLEGDYTRFNAVHVASSGSPGLPPSGYLVPIGPGNWINLSFATIGPGPARALTVVMDPRAAVHAQCGILPAKDVSLLTDWVDGALAAMKATFRTGPLLAELRQIVTQGHAAPTESLLTPIPAEREGAWQWRQRGIDGPWLSLAIAPVDGSAVFPESPPILRDGVLELKLVGGIDA
jgi:hypothetical protein